MLGGPCSARSEVTVRRCVAAMRGDMEALGGREAAAAKYARGPARTDGATGELTTLSGLHTASRCYQPRWGRSSLGRPRFDGVMRGDHFEKLGGHPLEIPADQRLSHGPNKLVEKRDVMRGREADVEGIP